MKKSEKVKGKKAVAERKSQYKQYSIYLIIAAAVIAIVLYATFTISPPVKVGDTVDVYYTGTLDNGTIFDSNVNSTPLEFVVGSGEMIKGFDAAVVGMTIGSSKTVHIPVDQAYGPYYPDLISSINRSDNPNLTPVVGDHLKITNATTGYTFEAKVINVTSSTITFDANYDLAGQNLTFNIKLANITQRK